MVLPGLRHLYHLVNIDTGVKNSERTMEIYPLNFLPRRSPEPSEGSRDMAKQRLGRLYLLYVGLLFIRLLIFLSFHPSRRADHPNCWH